LKREKTSNSPTPILKTKGGNTNLKSKAEPRKVLKNKGARAEKLGEVQGSRKRYLKASNNRPKRALKSNKTRKGVESNKTKKHFAKQQKQDNH
jgi:hypothetical protein